MRIKYLGTQKKNTDRIIDPITIPCIARTTSTVHIHTLQLQAILLFNCGLYEIVGIFRWDNYRNIIYIIFYTDGLNHVKSVFTTCGMWTTIAVFKAARLRHFKPSAAIL